MSGKCIEKGKKNMVKG